MEIEKLTKKENEKFAREILSPIITRIDRAVRTMDVKRIKKTLAVMHDSHSTVQAWPFPETMRKADEVKLSIRMLEAMIKMMEIRKEQMKLAATNNRPPGMEVLKQMGF